jgi:hypothetical protein
MRLKLLFSLFLVIGIASGIVSIGSADPNVDMLYPSTASGSACIGSIVSYEFQITNTTLIAASFSIFYSSTWPYEGLSTTPTLAVGEIYYFTVSVYIPWTAQPGEDTDLNITVTGGGFSGSATATTTANFNNDWIDLNDNPNSVRWLSVVYDDGRLYKIGGDVNWIAKSWLDIYDIEGNTWSSGEGMPGARYLINCEAIAGKIYCAGGTTGFYSDPEQDLFIYDIGTDEWSTGPDLPYGLSSYASAVHNGMYYLIGGNTGTINTPIISNAVLAYDPSSSEWETLASMSQTRSYHAAGVINGKIIVAGGYNGEFLDSVEVYDPLSDTWNDLAALPSPWVNAADGVNQDRYLIMAGGSDDSAFSGTSQALVYDAVKDTWSWLPDLGRTIFGAEGDSDGTNFWYIAGRLFDDGWTNSPYTTLMDSCASTCPSPVTGADFTWSPPEPWTGYTVELTATTTSGSPVIDFSWSFSDESTDTGSLIEHFFTEAATYSVELTATNCDGASESKKSHDITVLDPPIIEANPTGLNATLLPDQTTQKPLELCNRGDVPLNWEMDEIETMPLMLNGDLPWLSESVVIGVIPADNCIIIDVTFNSLGLAEGIYLGILSISNNDPALPVMEIPVSLTVASSAIDLIKTISLSDTTCGTANQLNVYPNTTVYYCYTVTNTGGVQLDVHDLTDTRLGELLKSYNYDLQPGDSFYVISAGVLITEKVTNEATWHAVSGDYNALDTDSATVTVIPEPDFWVYLPMILRLPIP